MANVDDWTKNKTPGFASWSEKDEYHHGPSGALGDSVTETWFFAFSIPEANINCSTYVWVHSNLNVATIGLAAYQGVKPHQLAAELYDVHAYLDASIVGDGSDIVAPNSYRQKIIEPMKRTRITYSDPVRKNELDIEVTAVSPPVMRGNGRHFEQLMRTRGRLVLRGVKYDVDSLSVRDRSWGEQRPEFHNPSPPYTWLTGAFGEDFAFNVGAHDDPDRNPDWSGAFDVRRENIFKDGWVYRDGEFARLSRVSLTTRREPRTLHPRAYTLDMTDERGRSYEMKGEVIAAIPWNVWPNVVGKIGLARWTCGDRTGVGESQDMQWHDYIWRFGQ